MSFRLSRSYLPWWLCVPARTVARLLYNVRAVRPENVPGTGGALLLANHLSYVDAVALQLACPRPIRFVGHAGFWRHGLLRFIFDLSGTIPISPRSSLEGIRRVLECLERGEVVLMYPEGTISRNGQLLGIRRGFEMVARRAGVPIIPIAHDGLWGSIFSFSDNKYLFKSPRLMRTAVCVCFGEPMRPEDASAGTVRRRLLDLAAEAFNERPALKRHLGREAVRALARRPWRTEIVDRTAERRVVRAGQLLAVAAAFAQRLKRTCPERRVGVVLPPGAGAAIANLAIVCAGKIPVNLNFTAGRGSLEACLRIGQISTVISVPIMREKAPNFPWPERTLDLRAEIKAVGKASILAWMAAAWVLPNQWMADLLRLPRNVAEEEEAGLLFTSGSSGEPKGVPLTHRNILANCWQISSMSILPDSAVLLGCLPLFHCFGFTVTMWYPLLRGCHVVTVPSPLDTRKIIDAIREDEVTVLIGAPTFLRPILKKAGPGELRTLNLVVSGAEKMPMELFDAYLERFHIEIMQGYGLTETSPVTSVNQPNPPLITEIAEPQLSMRLGSVGRMMPGMTARIVHPDTHEELPATQIGMLMLKGANVFRGYVEDVSRTRGVFRGQWFLTGDLARFDDEGFLYIEGRLSRFSKIGGEMVPHGTIEQKILAGFGWEQFEETLLVVVGVPDAVKGEALVLLTVREITVDEVRDNLLEQGLPALWIPKVVLKIAEIPMVGAGKVDLRRSKEIAVSAVAVPAA